MPDDAPDKGQQKTHGLSRNTWLIGGIVVGGIAYFVYKAHAASSAANAAAAQTAGLPASDTTTTGAVSSTTAAGTPSTFSDFPAWMQSVEKWSTSLGNDAGVTQNALQSYQLGNCLSAQEYAILDAALSVFGQPPDAPTTGLQMCTGSTTGSGSGSGGGTNGAGGSLNSAEEFNLLLYSWATSLGNSSGLVRNALAKWNTGQCLDPSEYAIISVGLKTLGGGPPSLAGPKQCGATTAATTAPAPAQVTTPVAPAASSAPTLNPQPMHA